MKLFIILYDPCIRMYKHAIVILWIEVIKIGLKIKSNVFYIVYLINISHRQIAEYKLGQQDQKHWFVKTKISIIHCSKFMDSEYSIQGGNSPNIVWIMSQTNTSVHHRKANFLFTPLITQEDIAKGQYRLMGFSKEEHTIHPNSIFHLSMLADPVSCMYGILGVSFTKAACATQLTAQMALEVRKGNSLLHKQDATLTVFHSDDTSSSDSSEKSALSSYEEGFLLR